MLIPSRGEEFGNTETTETAEGENEIEGDAGIFSRMLKKSLTAPHPSTRPLAWPAQDEVSH